MSRAKSLSLLGLSLTLLSSATLADTVWLTNGDRLTGTIRFFDGSKLLLETDYGGSIPLSWKKIATLESDHELLVKLGPVNGERAKALLAAEPGKVTLANGDVPTTVELAQIEQIMKPKPLVEDFTWKGNVDLALDYKRGERDSDDYDVDVKTQARHGLWRHNAQADYNRELKNDVVSTDNWSAEYALDRFLTEQWFWQGRFEYKRDRIEEVERQRTLGTGPGYQFWDNELGAFSVATLANRSDYRYSDGEQDRFYALSVKWDYNRYLIGKTVELFSSGEVGKPLEGVADYTLDAEVGLRYKVTDWASLNMKAEKDIVSGADGDLDETRYTLGFGVGW
ncbi:peptide chain release factor RF-3 [Ectopseudomonas mendocina]|nr:peptide chain release factor RF-3 [Pseudomonas mendocina]